MKSVIKAEKLEALLVAKWAEFLDVPEILSFMLKVVRDRAPNFTVIEQGRATRSGNQITLSRFQLIPQGFTLWVEFIVPIETGKIAIGTSELLLTYAGQIFHSQTLGDLYCTPGK